MTASLLRAAAALAFAATVAHGANPPVGGAPMLVERNIVENAVNSPVHTTLVAAVQAAGLVDALQGPGPFTVFAPVNDAFAALPPGTVETLLKPENVGMLQKVLTAHVVAGKLDAAELRRRAGRDGFVHLTTLSGDALSVQVRGDMLRVFSESRDIGTVTIADVNQSNGVIHVVDTVLVPR